MSTLRAMEEGETDDEECCVVHPWTLEFSDPEVARAYFAYCESSLSAYTKRFLFVTATLLVPPAASVASGNSTPSAALSSFFAVITFVAFVGSLTLILWRTCLMKKGSSTLRENLTRGLPGWITAWNVCRAFVCTVLTVVLLRRAASTGDSFERLHGAGAEMLFYVMLCAYNCAMSHVRSRDDEMAAYQCCAFSYPAGLLASSSRCFPGDRVTRRVLVDVIRYPQAVTHAESRIRETPHPD